MVSRADRQMALARNAMAPISPGIMALITSSEFPAAQCISNSISPVSAKGERTDFVALKGSQPARAERQD
jgi:hypothetical protein